MNPPSDLLVHWAPRAPNRSALVLGAGGGEEANWLVGEGFRVTAVEKDPARCAALAAMFENTDVDVREADIGDFGIVPQAHGIIVALAVLHFVHPRTLPALAGRISEGLAPGGLLLAQVLTDEDPSADVRRAAGSPERFQNTFPLNDSQGVIHYFGEGELAALFARLQPLLDERYRFAAERDGGYGAGEAFVALRPSRDRSYRRPSVVADGAARDSSCRPASDRSTPKHVPGGCCTMDGLWLTSKFKCWSPCPFRSR